MTNNKLTFRSTLFQFSLFFEKPKNPNVPEKNLSFYSLSRHNYFFIFELTNTKKLLILTFKPICFAHCVLPTEWAKLTNTIKEKQKTIECKRVNGKPKPNPTSD